MSDSTWLEVILAFIAGGGLAALATLGTRRAEFRREDHARWVNDRRDAYSRLIVKSQELINFAGAASVPHPPQPTDAMAEQHASQVSALMGEMRSDVSVLMLLAPETVRGYLPALVGNGQALADECLHPARGLPLRDKAMAQRRAELSDALSEFVDAARRDLRA